MMSSKSPTSTPMKDLTLEFIRRDCANAVMRRSKRALFGYCLGFLGVVFAIRFFIEEKSAGVLIGALSLFAASTVFILWARRSVRQIKNKISSGDIRIIRSHVDHKEWDSADDEAYKFYLHFSLGPEGRYVSETSISGDDVHIGDPYYLVLDRNRKGKLYVLAFYSAREYRPDAWIRELLARDAQWTGEQISYQELHKREFKHNIEKMVTENKERLAAAEAHLPELTSEEVDALPGKYIRLKRHERFLKRISFLSPIIFLVLGFLFLLYIKYLDPGIAWYWRLAYTLALLLSCYGSIFVRLQLTKRSAWIGFLLRAAGVPTPELPEKTETSRLRSIGCLVFSAGYFFSSIGHLLNAMILLLIWFGSW